MDNKTELACAKIRDALNELDRLKVAHLLGLAKDVEGPDPKLVSEAFAALDALQRFGCK